MKRGPKPRTKANSRPAKGQAPGESGGRLSPPPDLKGEVLDEYRRLVAAITRAGTVERADVQLVVMAARTQVLLIKAWRAIDRLGLTLKASNGTQMRNPHLATANSLTLRMRGLLNDLGLTPASAKLADTTQSGAQHAADPWSDSFGVVG